MTETTIHRVQHVTITRQLLEKSKSYVFRVTVESINHRKELITDELVLFSSDKNLLSNLKLEVLK